MDMTQFSDDPQVPHQRPSDYKLRKHCKAIRENKVPVAVIMLALEGWEVDLHRGTVRRAGTPLAGFAKECLDEISSGGTEAEKQAHIDIYSCSPTAGGVWSTSDRRMLKTGE